MKKPTAVSLTILFAIAVLALASAGCRVGHHGLQWFWAPDPKPVPQMVGATGGGNMVSIYTNCAVLHNGNGQTCTNYWRDGGWTTNAPAR